MAKYIYKHRRGTISQWADHLTTIPHEGEIVIEIDDVNGLHKLKIGDGIRTYGELAYLQAGDEIVTQVLNQVMPRIVTVELTVDWSQASDGKYSQTIALDNVTANSRLDLQPTADMIAEFKQLGLTFVTENNGGTITIYSVGNMPTKSYTMQATIVETECNGQSAVVGIPVGAAAAQSDWTQTDDTKSDYIKNKPTLGALAAKSEVAKTDLASDVQASLGKADTAIQSVDNKVDKEDGKGLSTNDFTDAYKQKVDSALQSYTESDPTVPDWAKASTKPDYTASEVGALPDDTTLADLPDDASHRTVTDSEKTTWNAKLDKAGGTISGSLAITGDLTVSGTTISEDHETIVVEDNMVVLNSNKVDLQTALSGLAINKDTSSTYGAVYDPTDATFKFGEGTLDANNEFTFNNGEGLPFAVRNDSTEFTDGHIVEWSADGNKLVDSGKTVDDYVEKVSGKGLSTNDFTDEYKSKVDSALQSYTETDPTVPAWAKASAKPIYTADEVGAVAYTAQTLTEEQKAQARSNIGAGASAFSGSYNDLTDKPTTGAGSGDMHSSVYDPQGKAQDMFAYTDNALANSDFATKTEAQGYANTAESSAKAYTDEQIAAIPTPDVSGQINTHNTSGSAHTDIRQAMPTILLKNW